MAQFHISDSSFTSFLVAVALKAFFPDSFSNKQYNNNIKAANVLQVKIGINWVTLHMVWKVE